jgi:hypothetical protein
MVEEFRTEKSAQENVQMLKKKIDGMTYLAGVHFSEQSKETLEEKIKRMIINESSEGKLSGGRGLKNDRIYHTLR